MAADPLTRYDDNDRDVHQSQVTRWASRFLPIDPNPFPPDIGVLSQFDFHPVKGLPPFQGGLVGMFGYSLGRAFETLPQIKFDEFLFDDLVTAIYDWVIAFDHKQMKCWLISTGIEIDGDDSWSSSSRALERFRFVREQLDRERPVRFAEPNPSGEHLSTVLLGAQYPLRNFPNITSNLLPARLPGRPPARPSTMSTLAIRFQVNLSQRLLAPLREHPLEVYGRLRACNPAPYGCYFDLGDFQIPLRVARAILRREVTNGEVVTRPIKGTRPRGKTPAEDAADHSLEVTVQSAGSGRECNDR